MLAISIKKDGSGNLLAVANGTSLFCVGYRKELRSWVFWLRGDHNPEKKEGKAFPWIYFTDLCRAVAFLRGEPLWSSDATKIVSGKSYIKRITG